MSADDDNGALKCVKLVLNYVFSHVGLCILVCGYCVGGAFLFIHIEGDGAWQANLDAQAKSQEIEVERLQLAKDLWKHKWSPVFNETVDKLLEEYHENITAAIGDHGYSGVRINSTDELTYGWAVPSALLFTITIVSTIGYGHVSPVTEVGQLVVIFYSLLGIPLMLMFLANIGDAMANFFRVAYGRGCCYFCWKQRKKNYEVNEERRKRGVKKRHVGDAPRRPRSAWSDDGKSPRQNDADKFSRKKDDEFSRQNDDNRRRRSGSPTDSLKKRREEGDLDSLEKGEGIRRRRASLDSKAGLDRPMIVDDRDPFEYQEEEVINVPISLTLVIIAAYIFIGAVLFAAWNNWSWIKGAYFSFVTLSTIGFGDLVPGWEEAGTTIGKVKLAISSFYIVLGLAVISMSFNLMMEEMIAKFRWLGKKLGIIDDDVPAAGNVAALDDKTPLVSSSDLVEDISKDRAIDAAANLY